MNCTAVAVVALVSSSVFLSKVGSAVPSLGSVAINHSVSAAD